MTRQRVNIDFGPLYHNWLDKKAKQLGMTRTELCRALVTNAIIYGADYNQIKESVKEHRELANQARALTQIENRRPPQR